MLPKTFQDQDAMAVTRGIGVRYLWIDSLCIVQDDVDDWKREATKMGRLYENAVLTIAASGAQDSTRGCFINKSQEMQSEPFPYFPDFNDTSASGFFYIHQVFETIPAWGPLQSRGWVVQEWRLSRRIVHFTEGGMQWVCKEHIVNEYKMKYAATHHVPWDSLLQSYSKAEFTYSNDCLIALQGLVSEMQIARKDQYYFGIWTADLPEQLLWMRQKSFVDGLPDAPSWSWASKYGEKIFLRNRYDLKPLLRGINPEAFTIADSGKMTVRDVYTKGCKTLQSTIECSCDNHDELEDMGKLLARNVGEYAHYLFSSLDDSVECPFGRAIFDGTPGSDLHCLFVAQTCAEADGNIVEDEDSYFLMLLLRAEEADTGETSSFRRVGVGISLLPPDDERWTRRPSLDIN